MWKGVKIHPLTREGLFYWYCFVIVIAEGYSVNRIKSITWKERREWLGPYFLGIQRPEDMWSPYSSRSALPLVGSSLSPLPFPRWTPRLPKWLLPPCVFLTPGPVLPGCLLWHLIQRRLGLPVSWSIIACASHCRAFFVFLSLLT